MGDFLFALEREEGDLDLDEEAFRCAARLTDIVSSMKFGVYIHIPYCLQVCPYCDFTKYQYDKIMPPEKYVELLSLEIRSRADNVPLKTLNTLYFGGGTPSLFDPPHILAIITALEKAGFERASDCEMTIEIDPATVDQSRLDAYRRIGFNRFSVGAQTFNSRLLKIAGRKHTAEDTVELLTLLKSNKVNYSFDLLFALPSQSLEELRADVATALSFEPPHLSAYCLTVPEGHPMSRGRAPESDQVTMFDLIESQLRKHGVLRYEISNFAKPGFESHHNMLYWTDQAYWGVGTGAHSYFPPSVFPANTEAKWGLRFWNLPSLPLYERSLRNAHTRKSNWRFIADLPENEREILEEHQSLTDFCHTSLRLVRGMEMNALRLKYGENRVQKVQRELMSLENDGLVAPTDKGWSLTANGRVLANVVFERLTFLKDDLS